MRVVVYDRTSGDEHEGQDAAAQLAQTVHRAAEAGHEVVGAFFDEDVSGDVDWDARPGLIEACEVLNQGGSVLLVREVSRLWRGDPVVGLSMMAGRVAGLVVLDAPTFNRVDFAWVDDSDSAYLVRFIDLWSAWSEKRRAETRSALAMREITEGRRATRSGKPPGRQPVEIEPAHVERAREARARGASWTDVREEVLRLRGYYEVKDAEARKRRDVSVDSIKRALGAKPRNPRAGHKADPGTKGRLPAGAGPGVNESLVPKTKPDAGNMPDEMTVDGRGEVRRAEGVLSSRLEGSP